MNIFRKLFSKPIPVAVNSPVAKKAGFFSTDAAFGNEELSEAEALQRAFSRTFQRSWKDLKITTGDGDLVTANAGDSKEMIAQDEAYPDLQLAKIQNSQFGYLPAAQIGWYAGQGFIGYQTCAMISQNWLIDKAVTMPARDAVRHGYEITVNDGKEIDPEIRDYIELCDKEMGIKRQCVEFLRMGRIFGIRVALFEVESTDDKYYEKPFNIDGVRPGSYKGISQIDPYWITPELSASSAANPASRHFYEPTWWRINGQRVHRTHLVIMRNGDELPDILKPTYFYGGIPIPQKIAERVYAAERTANEAPMLAMTKRLTVLSVDISQAMANADAFLAKMNLWTQIMNSYGVKVVGESEEIQQFDTSLADVDEVIMTQFQLVAAAAEVPATKLLGTSPKGFGASGEYEESSYHEMLESLQEHELTPFVERHHLLVIKSRVAPKFGIAPFATAVNWKPTDTPTAKEVAEINKLKAEAGASLVMAGAIDGTDERERIVKDPDSGYNGMPLIVPGGPGDREAQQEAEAALEQPVQNKPAGVKQAE